MDTLLIIIVIVLGIMALVSGLSARTIKQYERGLVFRFGGCGAASAVQV